MTRGSGTCYDNAVDTESALAASLEREGFQVYAWADPPGAYYPEHIHPGPEVRVVLEGSITIGFASGTSVTLGPGDRLDVPAGTVHWARVGPEGVRYLCGVRR